MRRDMIIVGLVVLFVAGIGALLAFMSGDAARLFQSVRFALMDEPPAAVAPRPTPRAFAPVQGCKYCATLKTLQQSFAQKASAAKSRKEAAERAAKTGGTDAVKGTAAAADRKSDLAEANEAFERSSTAAQALKDFAEACEQEAFCQPGFLAKPGAACSETAEDAELRGPAMGMASVAREAALACVAAACPQVDCDQAMALRFDLIEAAQAMTTLGAPVAAQKGQPALKDLPVGAATLSNEMSKAIKDIEYVAKLYPALLEQAAQTPPNATPSGPQLPAMIADLAQRQSEAIRSAADVMTQAAIVTPFVQDVRREAAWRMKALSLSVAEAGRMSVPENLNGPQGKAFRLALSQSWGAALVDLASAVALLDRMAVATNAASGCNGQMAAAAQAAREAAALLDVCRARAACPVGGGPQSTGAAASAEAARALLAGVVPRAQSSASVLAVGLDPNPVISQQGNELAQAALVLNAGGACRANQ